MFLRKRHIILLIVINFSFCAAQKECYDCKSSDKNCISELSQDKKCKFDEGGFCYTSVDDKGMVTRGCATKDTECKDTSCKKCDDSDFCNNQNICQNCDSSKVNECATSNSINNNWNTVCDKKDTKCVVLINDKKFTERRCATDDDLKACENSKTSDCCEKANCNSDIFPKNRLRCYQCDSNHDSKCKNVKENSETISAQICPIYEAQDKCYTFATGPDSIIRGCVSDADSTNKCVTPGSNELCATCDNDNCNGHNYKRNQSLRCIQCKTSKDDKKCLSEQSITDAKDCTNQIEYNKEEKCYTQKKDDEVYRGCFYDRSTDLGDCTKENGCDSCTNENGCNKDAFFSCIRCRSDNDFNCYDHADKMGGDKCRNPVSDEKNGVCFHGIWNDVVIRGCLVDADSRMQAICNDPKNNQCITCSKGPNCNTEKTSGATSLMSSGLIVFFATFILRKL